MTPLHIDLITARREHYPAPGALPSVTPSHIRDDLARRDFTINAIAACLTGGRRGELLDPFGGVADLDAGLIRVLHQSSFRDDATRLLRAAFHHVSTACIISRIPPGGMCMRSESK